MRDRLYELNFDPASAKASDIRADDPANSKPRSKLPQTGEITQGLLARLREIGGLKPWGAIVYDKSAGQWGMAWGQSSRKAAVASARSQCKSAQCGAEISFFGTSCGAFALSPTNWSIVSRDDIQKARATALDECAKRGKACHIVGAVPQPTAPPGPHRAIERLTIRSLSPLVRGERVGVRGCLDELDSRKEVPLTRKSLREFRSLPASGAR